MKEQLISFETAKLAKEKGFDLNTDFSYTENGVKSSYVWIKHHPNCENDYPILTQSLLQKWLREKHNIHIVINIDWIYDDFLDKELRYRYSLINMTTFEPISNPSTYNKYKKYFISFEDALEDAEFEALQLI